MKHQDHQQILSTNEVLKLNNPQQIWQIQQGKLTLFAVPMSMGKEQGIRRYLFSLTATEMIFGFPVVDEDHLYQVIAIASESTIITPVDHQQWCEGWSGWQSHLQSVLTQNLELEVLKDDWRSPQSQFIQAFTQSESAEWQRQWQQFQDRESLNQRVNQTALEDLASLVKPQKTYIPQVENTLLAAAGAVGKYLKIPIFPPNRSQNLSRLANPLEAIASASRFRIREVLLRGQWWTQDCGAFLAYFGEEKRPVALIPKRPGVYHLFDPQHSHYVPLTTNLRENLNPIAYTFYRSFPDLPITLTSFLRFIGEDVSRDIWLIIVTGVLFSLLGMLTPQIAGLLIDQVIPNSDRNLLWQLGLVLCGVTLGQTLFYLAQGLATLRLQSRVTINSQMAIWDRVLKLPTSFFRQLTIGDLASRILGIIQIRQLLNDTLLRTLFTSIFALLNLGLLFLYNPSLALIALTIGLVALLITAIAAICSYRVVFLLENIKGEIIALTVQMLQGIPKLRVAGAEKRAFAYWSKSYHQRTQLMLKAKFFKDGVQLNNTILPPLSYCLIFAIAFSLNQNQASSLSTGTFIAFNTALKLFLDAITKLSIIAIDIIEISVIWERIKAIIHTQPEVDLHKTDPGRLQGNISIDQLSFRYHPDSPLTLHEVSLEIKAGEFVAFVGSSGSGKSTIIRLLLGFEKPEEGKILYDGQDLSGLDITAIRRQLGVVLQNGRISSGSIFDNIASGALISHEEAWEAAEMAGLVEDIEQMPMEMQTIISEGGSNLSGGQRQRLLIARALVLKPKILIFDEATSALDNRTQAIVSENLDCLQVTRIVIAHRLSTIRNCDRIYVIHAGRVIQQGKFAELLEQPGLFADLMARQLA